MMLLNSSWILLSAEGSEVESYFLFVKKKKRLTGLKSLQNFPFDFIRIIKRQLRWRFSYHVNLCFSFLEGVDTVTGVPHFPHSSPSSIHSCRPSPGLYCSVVSVHGLGVNVLWWLSSRICVFQAPPKTFSLAVPHWAHLTHSSPWVFGGNHESCGYIQRLYPGVWHVLLSHVPTVGHTGSHSGKPCGPL